MKIQGIRAIAKAKGVNSARRSKGEIIRAVQEAEGNFPSFGTARDGYCHREDCAWREDCLPPGGGHFLVTGLPGGERGPLPP
jgi:hypothetical protein